MHQTCSTKSFACKLKFPRLRFVFTLPLVLLCLRPALQNWSPIAYLLTSKKAKKLQAAEVLLAIGADINASNKVSQLLLICIDPVPPALQNGRTALHMLVAEGRSCKDELKWLLTQKNLDVDAADVDGNTALYIAARGEDSWLVKLLIQHGATLVANKVCVTTNAFPDHCDVAEGQDTARPRAKGVGAGQAVAEPENHCLAAQRCCFYSAQFLICFHRFGGRRRRRGWR